MKKRRRVQEAQDNMDDSRLVEEPIDSELIFEGRVISLFRDRVSLPGGKAGVREIVRHNGGVCIAAVGDGKEVTFVRQYRHAVGEVLLELPAGKLEAAEDPDEAAARELSEETGITAKQIVRVGEIYPSPGYTSERIYLYIATGLSTGKALPDEDEFLGVCTMPLAEAVAQAEEGIIKDAKTVALLFLAQKYFNNERHDQ